MSRSQARPGDRPAARRGRRWSRLRQGPHAPWLVVAAAIVLLAPLVGLPITYRSDIWRQADTAAIARNFARFGHRLFYPQIDWGGAGPGYVEAEFQLFPWVTSLLYAVAGHHVWIGRAVALAASAGTLAGMVALARRLLGPRGAVITVAVLAATPLFVRYATAFMPEATVLCAYAWALVWFDRWCEAPSRRNLAMWATTSALAFLVKPTSLHLGLVFVAVLVVRRGWRALFTRPAMAFAAVSLAPVAAWLVHARNLHERYGNTFGVVSGGDRKFGTLSDLASVDFYRGVVAIDLRWVVTTASVPLFLVGIVAAARDRRLALIPAGAASMAVYYFGVARYAQSEGMGAQYHLFATVFAALGIGLGAERALAWLASPRLSSAGRTVVAGGVLAAGAGLVYGFAWSYVDQFRDWGQSFLDCGDAMKAQIPRGDLVVISSSDVAKAPDGTDNNWQEPILFFHGDVRGWSLPADRHDVALVEQYRAEGARWFVLWKAELLDANPELASYLGELDQVGPGTDAACGVYRLATPE